MALVFGVSNAKYLALDTPEGDAHKLDNTLPIYNTIKFKSIARCQKIK